MNNLEKNVLYVSLYDFYKELLTDKQREVFEEYYFNDFSLSEIADDASISRSAVYDNLSKVEKLLIGYEDKLHLKEKFDILNQKLDELKKISSIDGQKIIEEIKNLE